MTNEKALPASAAPHIDWPEFSGPFQLLLHLIERETLDITTVSLTRVIQQYLAQMESLRENRVEQLIDFLVVAARLALIKSRALLPQTPEIPGAEIEEDPAEQLVRQLREYRRFKEAASWLAGRQEFGLRTYLRVAPPPLPPAERKLDTRGVTLQGMLRTLQGVLARSERREDSVSVVQPQRVTIESKLGQLRARLRSFLRTTAITVLPMAMPARKVDSMAVKA